jgi:hypothetical protein
MTREARARSAARVDRLVAVPVAAGVVIWLKGVAIAAGLGVVTVVTVTRVLPALQGAPSKAVAPVSAGTTSSHRSVEIPAPPPVTVIPTPTAISTATPTPTATPTAIPTSTPTASTDNDGLAREVALLEKARGALDRDPSSTLAMLDVHAAEFPNGTLSMERELLAVDALRRLGRVADAKARGEALLGRARGSIYERRVKGMLDGLASP